MNKLLLRITTICLLALLPIVVKAQATTSTTPATPTIIASKYPPPGKVPPIDPKWVNLVDYSKLPNIPVRTVGQACGTKEQDTSCYWPCYNCLKTNANETDIATCPNQDDWGISYDDGPSPFTPPLLDYLKSKNVKVTFFVIGTNVLNNADVLARAAKEGHQIGVHTWSHSPLSTQTNEQIVSEIKWTETIIKDTIGLTPKYMRPPQGDVDNRVRGIMAQLGYKIVMWNRDTFDWTSNLPNSNFDLNWIPQNFTMWVQEPHTTGYISLEHDVYQQTAQSATKGIDIVMGAKRNIKPVATCTTGQNAFYLESNNSTSTTTTDNTTTSTSTSSSDSNSVATTTNYNILMITFGVITINIFISFF